LKLIGNGRLCQALLSSPMIERACGTWKWFSIYGNCLAPSPKASQVSFYSNLNLVLVVPIWNFIFIIHNNYLIIISFLFVLFQTWTMGKHMVKIGCLCEVLQLLLCSFLLYYIFLFIVSFIWFYVFAFASHWCEKQWSNRCWVWNNKGQRSSHCN
jgi:hypothetical protein